MIIRLFQNRDEADVIALWESCQLTRPWNSPARDIARKMVTQPELFFVGEDDVSKDGGEKPNSIVASAMAGYDGHRGWISYLAVSPVCAGRGYGRQMVSHIENQLIALGCPKINVQIRSDNSEVVAFYRSVGFDEDPVISMGKRLIPDK